MLPEIIVEVFIEERAVHVEQDEVDIFHRDHMSIHTIIISYDTCEVLFFFIAGEFFDQIASLCDKIPILQALTPTDYNDNSDNV
jgi:hypothetical protein